MGSRYQTPRKLPPVNGFPGMGTPAPGFLTPARATGAPDLAGTPSSRGAKPHGTPDVIRRQRPSFAFAAEETAKDGGEKIPGQPFVELQVKLKKEGLFVASEKRTIRDLYDRLNAATEDLMVRQSACRRTQLQIQRWIRGKLKWEDWEVDRPGDLYDDREHATLHPAEEVLGRDCEVYQEFVKYLHDHPAVIAEALLKVRLPWDVREAICRVVLFGVYGYFFPPQDDKAIIQFMTPLLDQHVEAGKSGKPENKFMSLSVFAITFRMVASETAHGYLKGALRTPVLAVMSSFDRDFALEPSSLWEGLSPDRKRQYTKIAKPTPSDLMALPSFMALLSKAHAFIIKLCVHFLECLMESVDFMPYTLRWIACCTQTRMQDAGKSKEETLVALSDLLMRNFITPAIINPQASGVVSDTPISPTAEANLKVVARVMSNAASISGLEERRPYMKTFHKRLIAIVEDHLKPLIARLVDVSPPASALGFPRNSVNHRGRRPAAVFSEADLAHLQLLMTSASQSIRLTADAMSLLGRLPDRPEVMGSRLFMLPLAPAPENGGVLEESVVLKTVGAHTDEGSGEGRLQDPVGKLRHALTHMSMNSHHRGMSLLGLLGADLADAVASHHPRASQVQETMRSVRSIPETQLSDGGLALFRGLFLAYQRRAVYVNYLVSTRQSLLLSIELVERQRSRIDARLDDCMHFFRSCKVERYLQSRKEAAEAWAAEFREIELIDEMVACMSEHFALVANEMYEDEVWASSPFIDEAVDIMQKHLVSMVYSHAFFPHPSDLDKDLVFHDHIRTNLAHIMPSHSSLQISEEHLSEAPWPLAQEKLLQINAFKSPREKLGCVVRCCNAVMDMLHMNDRGSAGADDFFPVLVYVILCANPMHLLSNIQYIEFFGSELTCSGEAAYWWAQFSTATRFIQSIDDRSDPTAFRLSETEAGSPPLARRA